MDDAEGLQGLDVGIVADVLPYLIRYMLHIQAAEYRHDTESKLNARRYFPLIQ